MTALFDAHCHIDPDAPPADYGADFPDAVRGRLLCGVNPVDWDAVAAAAGKWAGTIPAFGLHPWHAGTGDAPWLERLRELLPAHPDAWLGEAGLDGLREDKTPREIQERVFGEQLRLARRLDRKVNLHCVKAWEPLTTFLDAEYLNDGPRPFIVHSFGGPHQYIAKLAGRGAYFSVGPLFSRRDSPRHRQRAALLPEDRLLLESDAFLIPGRDAAADLEYTLAWLARVRGVEEEELRQRIDDNGRRAFARRSHDGA